MLETTREAVARRALRATARAGAALTHVRREHDRKQRRVVALDPARAVDAVHDEDLQDAARHAQRRRVGVVLERCAAAGAHGRAVTHTARCGAMWRDVAR
eukprot:3429585-Prymnesium_polylepis.1